MADTFNPDAYLSGSSSAAGGFDPDAYLGNPKKQPEQPSVGSFLRNLAAGVAEVPGNIADILANANPDAMPFQTKDLTGEGARVNKAIGNVTGFQPSSVKPQGFTDYVGRNIGANLPFMAGGVAAGNGAANIARNLAAQAGGVVGQSAGEAIAPDSPTAQLAGAVAGGGLTGGAVSGKLLSATDDARNLISRGITLTPGQMFGNAAKTWEDKLTSIPILGDIIKGGQRASNKSFNQERYRDALEPLGVTLPKGTQAGRAGVDTVADTIDQHYNNLLPQMVAGVDHGLITDLNTVRQNMLGNGARPDDVTRFNNIWDHNFSSRLSGNSNMNGQAMKDAQSDLTKITKDMMSSDNAGDRQIGQGLLGARQAMNDMLVRWNPGMADQLADINKAYARYATIRQAASALGAKDGVFSAPQFANAVRTADKSAGKGNYARGQAYGQDVSDSANLVLPSQVPDSGTTGRMLAALMMGGAASFEPSVAAGSAALSSLYTRPGMRALNMLGNRAQYPFPKTSFLPTLTVGSKKSYLGDEDQ